MPPRRPADRISDHLSDEIVIVGKAFRLPGGTNDDSALWDVLMGKNDSIIATIPPERWDHGSFFPRDICFERAGLVDVASYDYGFFGLTASEAFYVSPTMRIALEVAFEALENANIPISKVKGSKMGVFVATKDDGFETLLNAAHGYDGMSVYFCLSFLF
jgi:acyl transferase domain-containing protein